MLHSGATGKSAADLCQSNYSLNIKLFWALICTNISIKTYQ